MIATEVLNESVPRATKLVRAIVDAGGEITVDDARRQTGEQQLHHMVQPITTTTRRLSPRYFSNRRGLARPLDPIPTSPASRECVEALRPHRAP